MDIKEQMLYFNLLKQKNFLKHFDTFIELSSLIFLSCTADGRWDVDYISKSIQQFGYTEDEFLFGERDYTHIIHHEDIARVNSEVSANKKNTVDSFKQRYRVVTRNGDIRWVESHTVLKRDNSDEAVNLLATIHDITETVQRDQQINIFAKAVQHTDDLILITDYNGNIIFVNNALLKHSGYMPVEIIGQTPRIFKSDEYDQSFYRNFWQRILSGKTYSGTFKNRHKNGTPYYVVQTITPVKDERQQVQYFVATGKDISERIKLENELSKQATTDPLTGVYNRQKFLQEMKVQIARLQRYNDRFSIIMIDLDYFKDVNDTYGHDIGDNVLKMICQVIVSQIRNSDIFARWGGEEFMIISPGLTQEDAVAFAEKLRSSVESYVFDYIDHITISLGVVCPSANDVLQDIIKRVDTALYHSKNNGRNQVHFL